MSSLIFDKDENAVQIGEIWYDMTPMPVVAYSIKRNL